MLKNPPIKIVPAILNADINTVKSMLKVLEGHVDLLQIDIMDNKFVQNKTPGPELLSSINTKIPLDFHFMVQDPDEKYLQKFIDASSHLHIHNMTVHIEACKDLPKVIKFLRTKGIKPGIAVSPKTPLSKLNGYLDRVDWILMMTVEPGFSGQSFITGVMPKITELRKMKPGIDIEVDGGITEKTAVIAAKAGANVFVANSYILNAKDKVKAAKALRKRVS